MKKNSYVRGCEEEEASSSGIFKRTIEDKAFVNDEESTSRRTFEEYFFKEEEVLKYLTKMMIMR